VENPSLARLGRLDASMGSGECLNRNYLCASARRAEASAAGMSKRKITANLGMSAIAARGCIWRARRAGLAWPLPADLTDEVLEIQLYRPQALPHGTENNDRQALADSQAMPINKKARDRRGGRGHGKSGSCRLTVRR
jgi:hypothetical protein